MSLLPAAADPLPGVSLAEPGAILVIEDDEAVGRALCHVLEGLGYRALLACDARQALRAAIADEAAAIKLVVADVVMPKVNGREIVEWLKTVSPDVKVLLTSGHPGEIHAYRMGQYPGQMFIPKPFSCASLAHAVRAVLGN